MELSIISFTENGARLSAEIAEKIREADKPLEIRKVRLFTKCGQFAGTCAKEAPEMQLTGTCAKEAPEVQLIGTCAKEAPEVQFVGSDITEWTGRRFQEKNAVLFIGACGIAVRTIAPHLTDKLHDSPVLVADELGRFVIPILSGHVGGANELAVFLAEKTGACPVITTATDINGAFAADVFAKKNGLSIRNKDGIAKVSAKVLAGQAITIAVEPGHCEKNDKLPENVRLISYPPTERADIVISSEKKEFDAALVLTPREYVIGIGCKRGKTVEEIGSFLAGHMEKAGITEAQTAALASIDLKSDEPGLLAWSRKAGVSFVTYTAEELRETEGAFHASDFVKRQTGVDNVCERAALKAAGAGGTLVYEKHAENGLTIAVAKKKWSVKFDEA